MGLGACSRGLAMVLVLVAASMALSTGSAAADVSAGPLTFGSPQEIDGQPPYDVPVFPDAVSCVPGSTMCATVGSEGDPPFFYTSFMSVSTNAGAANPIWREEDTPSASVTGVSCPSTSLCVVGFDTADRYESGVGVVGISTDPSARTPDWHETQIDPDTGIADVSCPSTGLCVAVDNEGNVLISTDPSAANPKWSTSSVDGNGLRRVSCPAASLCVATDWANDVVISTDPTSPTPTWSAPANIDGTDQGQQVNGLSCASTSLCVATDSVGRAIITHDPADPAPNWSAQTIDANHPLGGISCSSTGLCVAAAYGVVITTTDPDATKPTWTTTAGVDAGQVSCASSDLCIATDQDGVTTSSDPSDSPSTWSPPVLVAGGNYLSSISCVSTSLCAATDGYGRLLTTTNPAAPTSSWTTLGNFPIEPEYISCPTSAFCLADDEGGNVVTSITPTASGSWHSGPQIPILVNRSEAMSGLSCAPAILCAAVTSRGRVAISQVAAGSGTPGSWVVDSVAPTSVSLTGISCPSASLCVAVDDTGRVTISTDPDAPTPTWRARIPVDSHRLTGVSCPSNNLCVAVDDAGRAVVTTDPTDPTPTWTVSSQIDGEAPLGGVSCAAETLCVAFDYDGSVFATSDPTAASPTWSAPAGVADEVDALSCTGAGLCVGTDHAQVVTGTAPSLTVSLAGAGSGTVAGTGIDCPSECATLYPTSTTVTLTATPASGSTFDGWTGGGCSGTAACTTTVTGIESITASFTPTPSPPPPSPTPAPAPSTPSVGPPHVGPPVNLSRPSITGAPGPGPMIGCSRGSWADAPAAYAYTWIRNGTPLAGATSSTYQLGKLDEGSTLVCSVTARNALGSASARSAAIGVPVPFVRRCPRATGRLGGGRLGLLRLGMTRQRVRRTYAGHARRSGRHSDAFCLAAAGIDVGYPDAGLLTGLPKHERSALTGHAVWASTSNPFYALNGIRTGEAGADAIGRLRPTAQLRSGQTTWYLARRGGVTSIVKVRHGAVVQLAMAASAVTAGRRQRSALLRSMS